MNKKYLELDERKAQFFEFSKEPKDGFEKNEPENGKISYRKYYDKGVKGVLKYINEREDEFKNGKVKKLSLVLDNGEDRFYVNFNILTAKGNMGQFVEQFIPMLPNMKQGESYRIYPYEMPSEYTDKDGNARTGTNRGVSVYTWDLANDTKLVKVDRAHRFGKDGDIPDVIWTKVTKMGETKNIKDDTERLNFLYDVLQKSLTPSSGQGDSPKEEPKESPAVPQTESPAPAVEKFEENHEDLPF